MLSVDVRERVVAMIDGGLSRRQRRRRCPGQRFERDPWHALARRTGAAMPKRQGGDRRSGRIEVHADVILDAVPGSRTSRLPNAATCQPPVRCRAPISDSRPSFMYKGRVPERRIGYQ